MPDHSKKKIVRLLGVGFDSEDGHVRITQGVDFDVLMGSDQCHEYMQRFCSRIEEGLKQQGRRLENISPEELTEFVQSLREPSQS
ncbi:MAG: hypothetical protein K9M45_06135 [Kiritimatiellales bacterium]|nr:hypothetical protein [Kiritimatiellales bacterium]